MPLSSTKTNCSGSSWAAASRQAFRASSSRSLAANVFFMCPAEPADGPPHRRHTHQVPLCSAHQAQCSPTVALGAASSRARRIASCSGEFAAGGREWACAPASRSRALAPRPV